ncbi:MAG: glycosyltransferase [Vulcanimicrobiaceae bacterium]
MLQLAVGLLWTGLVAYLLFRASRQYRAFPRLEASHAGQDDARVACIIPARNEAANIEASVRGLMQQDYPRAKIAIVVVDDGSTDATAQHVEHAILRSRDARLELVCVEDPPVNWAGKPRACWVGAIAAQRHDPDWLFFVDADTCAEPGLVRAAVGFASKDGGDMFSFCPRQQLGTVWERAFFPVGFMMVSVVQDLRQTSDRDSSHAAANGQCMLIRRAAYEACGGHAAVAREVCEDSALAARMKARGYRVTLVNGEALIRTRMYEGFRSLCEGLGKNIVEALGGAPSTLAAIALALTLTLGIPGVPDWIANTARGAIAPIATLFAALASLALFVTYCRAAAYFDVPPWYACLFPLGYGIGVAIALYGLYSRVRGSVTWKGRMIYSHPPLLARLRSISRVASKMRATGLRR